MAKFIQRTWVSAFLLSLALVQWFGLTPLHADEFTGLQGLSISPDYHFTLVLKDSLANPTGDAAISELDEFNRIDSGDGIGLAVGYDFSEDAVGAVQLYLMGSTNDYTDDWLGTIPARHPEVFEDAFDFGLKANGSKPGERILAINNGQLVTKGILVGGTLGHSFEESFTDVYGSFAIGPVWQRSEFEARVGELDDGGDVVSTSVKDIESTALNLGMRMGVGVDFYPARMSDMTYLEGLSIGPVFDLFYMTAQDEAQGHYALWTSIGVRVQYKFKNWELK